MNWFQQWLDKKLQLPMAMTMDWPPKKDPNCKDPMCDRNGRRRDARFNKRWGGARLFCHCVIIDGPTKRRINRWRAFFGLAEVR